MTIGDIVLATSLLETISKPFNEGGNLLIKLKAIGFKFDHLFRFLDSDNEQASSDTLPVSDFESIEFVDVSYQTKDTTLLEGINFTQPPRNVSPGKSSAAAGAVASSGSQLWV